ncbi:MAG: hypothetical protein LBC67_00520 [Spirochaetales bacterium]|jgi:hypothetical protein|nr:hypothetical protein [Spirochaetales bacterium]
MKKSQSFLRVSLALLALSGVLFAGCSSGSDDIPLKGGKVQVLADATPASSSHSLNLNNISAAAVNPGQTDETVEIMDMKLYIHSIMLRTPEEVIACANNPKYSDGHEFSIFDNHDKGTGMVVSPKENRQSLAFSVLTPSSLTAKVPENMWDILLIHISYGSMGEDKTSYVTYTDPNTQTETTRTIQELLVSGPSPTQSVAYAIIFLYGNAASRIPEYTQYRDAASSYLGSGTIQELTLPSPVDTRTSTPVLKLHLNAQGILKKDSSGEVYIDQELLESRLDEMLSVNAE